MISIVLWVALALNGCPHQVVVGNGPRGCDRWGGNRRIKLISSLMKVICEIMSVRHFSGDIGYGI